MEICVIPCTIRRFLVIFFIICMVGNIVICFIDYNKSKYVQPELPKEITSTYSTQESSSDEVDYDTSEDYKGQAHCYSELESLIVELSDLTD